MIMRSSLRKRALASLLALVLTPSLALAAPAAAASVPAQADPWQGLDWRSASAEQVRAIIAGGASIDRPAAYGTAMDPDHHLPPDAATPFLLALCYSRDVDLIEEFLGAGAQAADTGPASPLMYAAQYNSSPSILDALIVAGAEVRANLGYRFLARPALTYAAQYNDNPAVIAELVALGAEVNAKVSVLDNMGTTPLIYAAQYNQNPAVVEELIKDGAELELTDSMGRSPLIFAAQYNPSARVLAALLKAGAWLGAVGRDYYNVGFTPLMYAAASEYAPIEKLGLLLDAGSAAKARSREGKSAYDYAAANPAIPRDSRILRRLLEAAR